MAQDTKKWNIGKNKENVFLLKLRKNNYFCRIFVTSLPFHAYNGG